MNVTVGGEVEKPGVFPMTGQTTLLQAITQAGGVTKVAKEEEIIVFRASPDNEISAFVIDLKKIESGQLSDPLLAGNDKILVPKAGSKAFVRDVTDSLRGFISFTPFLW
jgi:polysaccharide export outer membrane protein